jgi:hypothetical protein
MIQKCLFEEAGREPAGTATGCRDKAGPDMPDLVVIDKRNIMYLPCFCIYQFPCAYKVNVRVIIQTVVAFMQGTQYPRLYLSAF